MARKQFVSSMKNAPSRAVSSKEAALQGRGSSGGGDLSDDDDLVSDGDDETASLNGDDNAANARGAASPVSSAASSPVSSDDDDDDDDDVEEENGKDGTHDAQDDDPADPEDGDGDDLAVAVQVMPASVGRGKQLRFPTAISRGKEARILHNGSDRDGSDSESYASVASDEEEDNDDEMSAATATTAAAAGSTDAVASPSKSPVSTQRETEEHVEEDGQEEDDTVYPIKAFRARKRHRPDSGYFTQMSTHVRDCLLSIRDVSTAEALSEEAHHDFRRKLSSGTVERVPWKQVSPPPPAAAPSDSEKKVPKASPERESSSSSERKRAREEMDSRSSSSRKSETSGERSDRRADKSSRSSADHDAADHKKERSGKENDSRSGSSRRDEKDSSRSAPDKKDSRELSEKSKSSKSSSSSKRVDENGHGGSSKADKTVCEDVLCAKCKKSVSEQNADEAQRKASVEATAKAAALQAAAAQATLDAAAATAAAAAASRTPAPAAANPAPVPPGTFMLMPNANREISQMREEAARLNDEARSLKHEGNRRGVADPGPEGQAAQGRYYLRSSAKFFQHALLLADIKAAYREAGDERSARTYGDYCMQTLAQTSSLIESTVRKMRTAGNGRLVALGYKLTSIVELTIYRLQHVKLFSIYSNLYTPGRSPDSRQNGTTPPINGSASDSQDTAMKALLLKEMEHTLRGFEMWQRYEMCPEEVLPRITNPAVVDLPALFEDLASELGQS